MSETPISGRDALRARVKSRLKRSHLARTATDLQIALPALESFASGGDLPEAAIHALVKEFYMNTKWDPLIDRLVDVAPPATVACPMGVPAPFVHPDPAIAKAQAAYHAR